MRPARLLLVPVGPLGLDPELLPWLGEQLRARLGVEPQPGAALELQDAWFDPERGQFRSNQVVDALVRRSTPAGASPPGEWVLGVTEADLFADGRDFVFGEATQGGYWALISLARLRDPERGLSRDRVLKEAAHELGHLAGLAHCDRPHCAMHPSVEPGDIDSKGADYCAACGSSLRARFALDRSLPSR